MSAITKTQALKRVSLPIEQLEPNALNPNKMPARAFDLLVDNIQRTGMTDPIVVRPVAGGKYRIVSGHHRWQAAQYLAFTEVPCAVIEDPEFGEEAENFQLVRMNAIRGRMDPAAFVKLYDTVKGKYADDLLQDLFGFAEEEDFRRLVNATAKSLPKELQSQFKEAAKEIKTIDGLAKLLNHMIQSYGNTLPYGYMVVDYGGQDSIWLRVSKKTFDACIKLGHRCIDNQRTIDDVVGHLLRQAADGELDAALDKALSETVPVNIPDGFVGTPTVDHVEAASVL